MSLGPTADTYVSLHYLHLVCHLPRIPREPVRLGSVTCTVPSRPDKEYNTAFWSA